jgi:hypothetical protein
MTESDDLRAAIKSLGPLLDDRRTAISHRRKAPRARTLRTAQIVWLGGDPVKCVVRNLSESGACLEVSEQIPRNTFDLIFDFDQSRRYCWVAWREPTRMGVKFR